MNNQRISLENAIMIASVLNRTLILPPFFIGRKMSKRMPFQRFDELWQVIAAQEREFYSSYFGEDKVRESELILSFNLLFNLSRYPVKMMSSGDFIARVGGRELQLLNLKDEERYAYKFIQPSNIHSRDSCLLVGGATGDTVTISYGHAGRLTFTSVLSTLNESNWKKQNLVCLLPQRNDSHELSLSTSTPSLGHFKRVVNLDVLGQLGYRAANLSIQANHSFDFIQFGSLFGSSRVEVSGGRQLHLKEELSHNFVYENEQLEELASSAIRTMRTRIEALISAGSNVSSNAKFSLLLDGYIGIHLRAGDGSFSHQVLKTLRSSRKILCSHISRLFHQDIQPHLPLSDAASPNLSFFAPVFIATDAPDSIKHLIISQIKNTSISINAGSTIVTLQPFVFTLSDLISELDVARFLRYLDDQQLQSESSIAQSLLFQLFFDLSPLDACIDGIKQPSSTFNSFLPNFFQFIDQMIVSRANAFIGTSGSTYSKYIDRLHKFHWHSNLKLGQRVDGLIGNA